MSSFDETTDRNAAGGAIGDDGGGSAGGSAGDQLSDTPGGGVSLGDVPAGSSAAAGKAADKDLVGPDHTGGGAGTSTMATGEGST
jgi:hypothetical protein